MGANLGDRIAAHGDTARGDAAADRARPQGEGGDPVAWPIQHLRAPSSTGGRRWGGPGGVAWPIQHLRTLSFLGLIVLLVACGGAAPTSTPPPTATTAPPPTPTLAPTNTPVPPTATPAPTATAAPTATSAPTATAARAATTPAPTATAARTATTPPSPSASPTATVSGGAAATRPAAGGGATATDSEGKCQMALPADFREDASSKGNFTSGDTRAFASLQSFDALLGLTGSVDLFLSTFKGFVTDYAEVSRVPSQSRGRDAERVDFTGSLAGQAVKGTLYFVQDGSTICSLSFLTFADAEAQYAPALAAMIDSLQAVKP
jgi:hypothetical protein